MELSNGVLIHCPTRRDDLADLVVTLTHGQFLALIGGAGTEGVRMEGDAKVLELITGLTDESDPAFAIVTP